MDNQNDIDARIKEMGELFDEFLRKMNELKKEQETLVQEYISKLSEKKNGVSMDKNSN